MPELTFSPSPDVTVVLNALLDIFERRTAKNGTRNMEHATHHPEAQRSGRSIRVTLADLPLPSYFSQLDPAPRLIANEQFSALEKAGLLKLTWLPGETGHILQAAALQTDGAARLYPILQRSAVTDQRSRLESLLLADKFRFVDDWRARALRHVLANLRAGKSPAPFSLTDSDLTLDLLTVLAALPALTAETPYRVFSVRIFNDSKRLETLKNQLVSLARLGSPEWKRLSAEEVLRELNLVPNPNYLHMAGNWQLTLASGEILNLGGFSPALGFPAAQIASLQSVEIHAEAVLCIENLTTFHEFIRHGIRNTQYATICTFGNPAPATRRLLRLLPGSTPIYHWSDLDYGGFNILSQLRRLVDERVEPYRMDIATLDANYERSRPLTVSDRANLKKLLFRPELRDVRPVLEHLLKRGVKLEQEGVEM
jgi:hypothetical protein